MRQPAFSSSTICAIATAQGGAIGVVRVSGNEAISITDTIFHGRRKLSEARGHTIAYGKIRDGGEMVDEVLVSVFRAPHSYTGEDATEISCHGSPFILQRVMEMLVAAGCSLAKPGEFTQRAFLNGKMDLSQAEAVADLIASKNASTHRIAMQQMRGGYSDKLRSLREELVKMTSLFELELDFSEEDVEFADRTQLMTIASNISDEIARLTSSFRQGNAIKNGVPVAIVGAPNVGKSTLLNALLQDDRAIVSETQGTTRDIIEDTVTIRDITFRFIDTAGIRHTDDNVEKMGIERGLRAATKAQIVILLTEPGVGYPDIPLREDQTVIRVVNKTDTFQALSGVGLQDLEDQLVASVSAGFDELLVTNLRHYTALKKAHDDLARAMQSLSEGLPADLVAEDLRACLACLADILGEITSTEVLNTIFSRFCIGK